MFKFKTNHLLTGEELSREELQDLLDMAEVLRVERQMERKPLQHKNVALLFEKPSLRTRVSFTVAIQELGGNVIELTSSVRKKEEPEDTIRVLEGYVQGVMLRTHDHKTLEKMTKVSKIPVINGLSDTHHPCQALADLQTLQQTFKKIKGLKIAYVGDGNNVLHSLLLLAPFLGAEVSYACPKGFEPNSFVLRRAKARCKDSGGAIHAFTDPVSAVKGAHAIYTDVWTSMGFEEEEMNRKKIFKNYQINEELYAHAAPGALIMHCMPMVRGLEITDTMVEHENSALFRQSENRLYAQKALLMGLMGS